MKRTLIAAIIRLAAGVASSRGDGYNSRRRFEHAAVISRARFLGCRSASWLGQTLNGAMKILVLLTILVTVGLSDPASGQGVLYQHLGANDPANEGFTLSTSGSGGTTGPILDDDGVDAWATQVGSGGTLWYSRDLDVALMSQNDWVLSLTLRVVEPGPYYNNSFVRVQMGSSGYNLWFSAQTDGDPIVRVGQFSTGPVYVLDGGGPGYHDYQLKYQTELGSAELWVDGVMQMNDIAPISLNGSALLWGENQAGPSHVNWGMVSLQIVPEPSAVGLLFAGLVLASMKSRAIGRIE